MKYVIYGVIIILLLNVLSFLTGGLFAVFFPLKYAPNAVMARNSKNGKANNYYLNPLTRNIYYIPGGSIFMLEYIVLPDANVDSFEVFYEDIGFIGFAKDKHNLYFQQTKVELAGADLDSLRILGFKNAEIGWLLQDKDRTYFLPDTNEYGEKKLVLREYKGDLNLDAESKTPTKQAFEYLQSHAELGDTIFSFDLYNSTLMIKKQNNLIGELRLTQTQFNTLTSLKQRNENQHFGDGWGLQGFIFVVGDVNFDGIDDLTVLKEIGLSDLNDYYDFYTGNKTGTFNFTRPILKNISNLAVNKEKKMLRSSYRSGPEWYVKDYQFKDGSYIGDEERLDDRSKQPHVCINC